MKVLVDAYCTLCKCKLLRVVNFIDAQYFWSWKCTKCGKSGTCPKEWPIIEHE